MGVHGPLNISEVGSGAMVAVELQPYGRKNLDGYRRAVVPPMHKTRDSADQNLSLTSTECILHSTHFPA